MRSVTDYAGLRVKLYDVLQYKLENRGLVSEWLDTYHASLSMSPMDYMSDGKPQTVAEVIELATKIETVPGVGWIR